MDEDDLDALRLGSLLHDIGKIAIPGSLLAKPGPLDFEERKIVRQHPVLGEQLCAPFKSFRHILPLIRSHHERRDGSGYPDGLRGDEIPLTVRVLQIVDICDALITDRPYRKGFSLPDAVSVLCEEAKRGWMDEGLVNKFASLVVGSESLADTGTAERFRPSEKYGNIDLSFVPLRA